MNKIRQRIMMEVNRRTIAILQRNVKDPKLNQRERDHARRMLLAAITIRERGVSS